MAKVTIQYIERTIREWQTAFAAANDKPAPEVTWGNGWFIVRGIRYRRAAFEEMRDRLRDRSPSPTQQEEL